MRPTNQLKAIVLLAGITALAATANAVSPGEFDDFEDGGSEFWSVLPAGPPVPVNRAGCGVRSTLCLEATFNVMDQVSISNTMQWRGSFLAPGIYEVRGKIRNVSDSGDVHLRVGVTNGTGPDPGTCYVSTDALTLSPRPATNIEYDLDLVNFPVDESSMTLVTAGASCGGSQPLSTVLRDVVEVRILSSESPSWLGDQATAPTTIWFDNIRAMSTSQTEWRWIGVLENGQFGCPVPDPAPVSGGQDWLPPQPLFGSLSMLPSALRNYCVYTFEEGAAVDEAQTVQIERLIGHGLLSAQPDFIAVTPPENVSSRSPGIAGCGDNQCFPDQDDDGIPDYEDNCDTLHNPDQCDTNGDGFGNRCDSDLDNNNVVNFSDLGILKTAFFSSPQSPNWDPDADLDCDLQVSFADLGIMKSQFFTSPGRWSLPNSGGAGAVGLEATMYNRFADQFNQRAGAPTAPLPTVGMHLPVRLALVDTQSPDVFSDNAGASPHGLTLAKMANRLLCDANNEPDANCLADLHTQPAMSWRCADDIERINKTAECDTPEIGGIAGLVGGLAESIWDEVRDWRDADAGDNLILNMSLAWNPGLGGLEINNPLGSFRQMPVAVQAVYAAIQDAVCRGALPIVAAGNAVNGTLRNNGGMLPAAWNNTAAPDGAECLALLGIDGPGNPPPAGTPLVHAAGGVRFDGSALFNDREAGEPRIVAYSDHAAFAIDASAGVPPIATRDRYAVLTGTSVGTLVTSAAAAAVWHYNPSFSASEVVQLTYNSGADLMRNAAITWPRGTPQTVRQIKVCESAILAYPGTGHGISCIPEVELNSADIKSDLTEFASVAVGLDSLTPTNPADIPAICDGLTLFGVVSGVDPQACPQRQLFSNAAAAGTAPKPCGAACPTCTLANSAGQAFLYIEIDAGYDFELYDPKLVCGDNTLALPIATPLHAGEKVQLEYSPTDLSSPAAICSTDDKVLIIFSLIDKADASPGSKVLSDISPVYRVVSP